MSDPSEGEEPKAMQPSAVDETTRKRRETKAKRKEREDREFFRLVMSSEAGRRFMWAILSQAHTFEVKFGVAGQAGFPQPEATWMYLGEQQLGQRLYQTWHLKAPQETMSMLRENDPRLQAIEVD